MIAASVGVGNGDALKAGTEACVQALSGLPKGKADVLFVFGSVALDQDELIKAINAAAPGTPLIGCSTAGEISSEGLSSEDSVVILALVSDQLKCWFSAGHHILWNPKRAGEDCANGLEYSSHGYVKSALVFLDIISGGGDSTLAGFLERAGEKFPLYGGAAGDNMLFFETYQYLHNKVYSGSMVGMGFSGDYTSAGVVMHGFLPIGVERMVTQSEGTTLYMLDDKPASSIYEEYFGEEHLSELHEGLLPTLAVSYPLGVFQEDSREVLLRNPVFVDQKGAMTFTAGIPVGSEVRLMISDIEEGLKVAEAVAVEVLKKLGGKKPKAALVINSVARKKMFGPRANEEITIIQRILGRDVPIAGFYSYAQVGTQDGATRSEGGVVTTAPFHNGSLLIWAIAE